MNHIPTDEELENLKSKYPVGTRIQLTSMNQELNPVPPGTKGTVTGIDDMGTIQMTWDNQSSLGLIEPVDQFSILPEKEGE